MQLYIICVVAVGNVGILVMLAMCVGFGCDDDSGSGEDGRGEGAALGGVGSVCWLW